MVAIEVYASITCLYSTAAMDAAEAEEAAMAADATEASEATGGVRRAAEEPATSGGAR